MDVIQISNISNQPVKTCIKGEFRQKALDSKCKFLLQKGETAIIPEAFVDVQRLKRFENMGMVVTQTMTITVPAAGDTKDTYTKTRGSEPDKKDDRKKEKKSGGGD